MCSLIFDGSAPFESYTLRKTDISAKIWHVHVVIKWRGKTLYLKEQLKRALHRQKRQRLHLLHLAKPYHATAQAKPCLSLVCKRSWKSFKLVDLLHFCQAFLHKHTDPNAIIPWDVLMLLSDISWRLNTYPGRMRVSTADTSSFSKAINDYAADGSNSCLVGRDGIAKLELTCHNGNRVGM